MPLRARRLLTRWFGFGCQPDPVGRGVSRQLGQGSEPGSGGFDDVADLDDIEDVEDLLFDIFGWSDMTLNEALEAFAKAVLDRLRQIQAKPETLSRWMTLVGEPRPAAPAE